LRVADALVIGIDRLDLRAHILVGLIGRTGIAHLDRCHAIRRLRLASAPFPRLASLLPWYGLTLRKRRGALDAHRFTGN
jgi:hypothetical protein